MMVITRNTTALLAALASAPLTGCYTWDVDRGHDGQEGAPAGDRAAETTASGKIEPGASSEGGAPGAPVEGAPSVVIARASSASHASGNAQQRHLVEAPGSGRYVLVYADPSSPLQLSTRVSPDFAAWTDGAPVTLADPHTGDGRDFGVTCTTAAGKDLVTVVHGLRVSSTYRLYHSRGLLDQGSLSWAPPRPIESFVENDVALGVSGADVLVGKTGFVYALSGWHKSSQLSLGNPTLFRTTTGDDGAGASVPWDEPEEISTVPRTAHAFALRTARVGGGETIAALWESGDGTSSASTVVLSLLSSVIELSSTGAVFPKASQDRNDWDAARVGDDLHVMRRTSAGAFEHRRWNGSSLVTDAVPPPLPTKVGSGVALIAEGETLIAATIGADANESVLEARWTAASGFSAWKVIDGTPQRREGIAAAATKRPTILWTETREGEAVIVGRQL